MNKAHTHPSPTLEQIVFTKVRDHLLVQGVRATGMGGCRYRGVDHKTSCAIGCLISDENYGVGEIEGASVDLTYTPRRLLGALADEELDVPIEFLYHLQQIHDSKKPRLWRRHLAQFARKYNLEWEPEPEGTRL